MEKKTSTAQEEILKVLNFIKELGYDLSMEEQLLIYRIMISKK